MSMKLTIPSTVRRGMSFEVGFRATGRVDVRVRLRAGEEDQTFALRRSADRRSEPAKAHRVRARSGLYTIEDWGDHPAGTQIIVRMGEHEATSVVIP